MDDPRDRFRIALRPSRTLLMALGLAYAGAAACLLSLDMELGIKGPMLAFLTLSGFCDLCLHAGGLRRRRVGEIILHPEGDWRVINGAGEMLRGKPVAGRLVHPLAICFSIRRGNAKRLPVLVLGDMCSADAFRQLRAWLRVHGEHGPATASRTPSVHNGGRP
jgi:hypothetical protein